MKKIISSKHNIELDEFNRRPRDYIDGFMKQYARAFSLKLTGEGSEDLQDLIERIKSLFQIEPLIDLTDLPVDIVSVSSFFSLEKETYFVNREREQISIEKITSSFETLWTSCVFLQQEVKDSAKNIEGNNTVSLILLGVTVRITTFIHVIEKNLCALHKSADSVIANINNPALKRVLLGYYEESSTYYSHLVVNKILNSLKYTKNFDEKINSELNKFNIGVTLDNVNNSTFKLNALLDIMRFEIYTIKQCFRAGFTKNVPAYVFILLEKLCSYIIYVIEKGLSGIKNSTGIDFNTTDDSIDVTTVVMINVMSKIKSIFSRYIISDLESIIFYSTACRYIDINKLDAQVDADPIDTFWKSRDILLEELLLHKDNMGLSEQMFLCSSDDDSIIDQFFSSGKEDRQEE